MTFNCVHVSRSDFILKLAQLREHWQGAVQRADQRRSLVEGLVKHWHLYRHSLKKLQRFLSDTQTLLPPAGPARCSLQQLRRSLQDLRVRQTMTELEYQGKSGHFLNILIELVDMKSLLQVHKNWLSDLKIVFAVSEPEVKQFLGTSGKSSLQRADGL